VSRDILQLPAQIIDFKPRADMSVKISFETRQVTGDEAALLMDNFRGEGWLVFKPNGEVSLPELPEGVAETGAKSPSQRLRAVLYILWTQKGKKGDFESFYRTEYEKLIEFFKSKLEPEE
jgi:hypothetical protein